MIFQTVKSTSFFIVGIILISIITGCSGGSNSTDPVVPQSLCEKTEPGNLDTLPVIAFDDETAIGVMGGYNLTISDDGLNADLVPMRTSAAVGDSYIVSGKAYFTMSPCHDCLKIDSLSLNSDGDIVIGFAVKHPFANGNTSKPETAGNRLDLDMFDLAMVVQPIEIEPAVLYSLGSIYPGVVKNADGYTPELSGLTEQNILLPYKICYEKQNNNRFEMGTDYQKFDVVFSKEKTHTFELYLTMGYGASAKKGTKLKPTYYIPEFNRKSAWKVEVGPVAWTGDDPGTVTIDIYDWNHGVTVATTWPDPTHTNYIRAESDVLSVNVEVPGMTDDPKPATTTDTTSNGWNDPLTYTATFPNELNLAAGSYTGLVKVADSRTPGAVGAFDSLMHTPDGFEIEGYSIPEFATYQTFPVTVSNIVPSGDLSWAKRGGAASVFIGTSGGYDVTSLSDNSTVVTGFFNSTATFGQWESNETELVATGPQGRSDILIARFNPDGTLEWAKQAGGDSFDHGLAITSLTDDSTVVTGEFRSTATFGPGEPNEIDLISAGNLEIFISRYNPDGTLAWAKRAGGTNYDVGEAVTALSDDSTVVTGVFSGSATFGPGETTPIVLASGGSWDMFVARYNPNGTLAWAKRAGGPGYEISYGITTLSDNSTVVTGCFGYGDLTFGSGESNQTVLTSSGGSDIFIARYNPNGTLAWAKRAGGTADDVGNDITTLSDNSTVVTGSFNGYATFGPGEVNETTLSSAGSDDIFFARFNPDGTLLWAKRVGGSDYDYSRGITSLSGNSTVITGIFYGTVIFGAGEINETSLTSVGNYNLFTARYTSDGSLVWAKNSGSGYCLAYGITSLSDNRTAVTGYFYDTCTFGLGEPNETELVAVANSDFFIAQIEP
jgi:uncharacterized delta-60 repeat protein